MWEIVAALSILAVLPVAPHNVAERPFLSCIDGHIVQSLDECPPIPHHDQKQNPPVGGGGRGGLLGLGIGGIL